MKKRLPALSLPELLIALCILSILFYGLTQMLHFQKLSSQTTKDYTIWLEHGAEILQDASLLPQEVGDKKGSFEVAGKVYTYHISAQVIDEDAHGRLMLYGFYKEGESVPWLERVGVIAP